GNLKKRFSAKKDDEGNVRTERNVCAVFTKTIILLVNHNLRVRIQSFTFRQRTFWLSPQSWKSLLSHLFLAQIRILRWCSDARRFLRLFPLWKNLWDTLSEGIP